MKINPNFFIIYQLKKKKICYLKLKRKLTYYIHKKYIAQN